MLNKSSKIRKTLAALMLVTGCFTSPLFARDTVDCYDRVIAMCDDALDDARFWEKPAIGLFCTGMLAGCGFDSF